MSILEEIKNYTILRLEKEKQQTSLDDVSMHAEFLLDSAKRGLFYNALKKDGLSVIAEIKKASPSKGIIDKVFDYKQIAKEYESAGADCVSCLTEPKWFMGSSEIFKDVRHIIKLPMLRKDFIIDEYQIFEAVTIGANAILLIASMLTRSELKSFYALADELCMDVLYEAHDTREVEQGLELGFKIIGINNRNLADFSVDFSNCLKLGQSVKSAGRILVAESGVKSESDVVKLKEMQVDAILVGETLMRSYSKAKLIEQFKNA